MSESEPTQETRSVFREYLEAILIAAIFLGFTNTFVVKTFYIPSSSMESTLLIGDHLFVNRFIYGPASGLSETVSPARDVRRGDIVIFRSPQSPETDLVKRCIGTPGDEIQMRNQVLFVNGQEVEDSSFATYDPDDELSRLPVNVRNRLRQSRDNFGPFQVPEGEYFFLGDNRNHSNDSRFWGTVPEEMIKGRALMVYWSYGGETPDGTWSSYTDKLRQVGKTVLGFLPKTRWSRSFHLIR